MEEVKIEHIFEVDQNMEEIEEKKSNKRFTNRQQNNDLIYSINNRYAYFKDKYDDLKENKYEILMEREMKVANFVPIYDNCCLNCDKEDVSFRCSKCRVIYFCDKDCQKEAWKIHKRHCGRDLFCVCINCGKLLSEESLKCSSCPVRFCSDHCYRIIINSHIDFDCDKLKQLFT